MSKVFTCRWANCRLEFGDEKVYKEHIDTHVESAEAILVSDMPYRRLAAGFGLASSLPQSEFDYLKTQDSSKTVSSTDIPKMNQATRKIFSTLGLEGQATPPLSPLIPSPSMSAQIRGSPIRGQTESKWNPPSPFHGLASSAMNEGSFATPSETAFSPAPLQKPSQNNGSVQPGDDDDGNPPVVARSQTPENDAAAPNSRKRKISVMFNEPITPANKKKKKNPKTPFPDPDLDTSEESDDNGHQLGVTELDAFATEDPYHIYTQAPGSSWDGLETPDDDITASLFLETSRTEGPLIEELEEREIASQLEESDLHIEDITPPSR